MRIAIILTTYLSFYYTLLDKTTSLPLNCGMYVYFKKSDVKNIVNFICLYD